MLSGLCKQHESTQLAAVSAIEKVHLLEQVSTELHIGTLAENLLETMMENPTCQAEVGPKYHIAGNVRISWIANWKCTVHTPH